MRAAARDDPLDAALSAPAYSTTKSGAAAASKQLQGQASGLPQTLSSASLSSVTGGQAGGSMGSAPPEAGSSAESAVPGDWDGQVSAGVGAGMDAAVAAAAVIAATAETDLQAVEAARSNLLQVGAVPVRLGRSGRGWTYLQQQYTCRGGAVSALRPPGKPRDVGCHHQFTRWC